MLKALGASKQQILWLFLTEATILSIAGAISGVLLGKVTLLILQTAYPDFPVILPSWAVFSALAVALLTALIFGVIPAIKAARLQPLDALRAE